MRIFQNKSWEYSVRKFELLARKKDWSVRYRLAYALQLSQKKSLSGKLRFFGLNFLGIINLVRYSLRWQAKRVSIKNQDTIVLLTNYGGYLKHILPVTQELLNRNNKVIALCTAKEYAKLKSTLPAEVAGILHPYESLSDSKTYGAGNIIRSFLYSLLDCTWFCFQPVKNAFWYSTGFGRYSYTQHLLNAYLKRNLHAGQVLLSANDHWLWESLLFRSAKEAGARSYVLQHGMVEEISYPMFARHFLAWGRQAYTRLTETFEASPNEVIITGSPYFDDLYKAIAGRAADKRKSEQPYITFLSQPVTADGYLSAEEYASIIHRFYSLLPLAEKHGKKLLVKLHPRENGEVYSNRAAGISLSKEALSDVLDKSCITITVDSTAIFESAMFKVPAIQTILPTVSRQMIFADSGVCLLTTGGNELYQAVEKLLSDNMYYEESVQKAQNALSDYFNGMKGALERIVSLLEGS